MAMGVNLITMHQVFIEDLLCATHSMRLFRYKSKNGMFLALKVLTAR